MQSLQQKISETFNGQTSHPALVGHDEPSLSLGSPNPISPLQGKGVRTGGRDVKTRSRGNKKYNDDKHTHRRIREEEEDGE